MKKQFLIIILLAIVFFAGCKGSNKKSDTGGNNNNNNIFKEGSDFNFYGFNGSNMVNVGGRVSVTPIELLNLGVKFKDSFLYVIADTIQSWPYTISLEIRLTPGGSKVAFDFVSTQDVQLLPMSLIDFMLNAGKGDYYMAACASSYGNDACSSPNKISYQGEDGSAIIPTAPSNLTANSGCTTIGFTLNGYNVLSNLYPQGGYLSQMDIYRNLTPFTDPKDASEILEFFSAACYPTSHTKYRCTLSGINYTNPGYIGVRVRDYQGKLSPMTTVISCN